MRRRINTSLPLNPSTGLLYGAGLAIALGVLGYNVVVNEQISIATMLILLVSLAGLAYPIAEWLRMKSATRHANRSARGIFEFLERRPELHQNVGAHFLNALKDQISIENVELESRSGRRLLEGVSVEIPAGSRTAIMGEDDDPKLALVCLIPRLLDPRSGRILIDGHDLRDVTVDSVRAQVATVLQADLVFTDSVLVNIGLGDPMNTLPRIIEAAKVAHAHHFIQDLPHGYDTMIGPLGHYFKPDEQFRIALARAYLHDPSILIVEEPKAPLDEDTRHFIDDTLSRLSIGRTLIIIPHRLSTVQSCDHVIVLHNGRVEDVGSPEKLQRREQAVPPPGLHRVQRVRERRDRRRPLADTASPPARRSLSQQKSSTVGVITSSGTWARGCSSTRKRTAAAMSSGCRMTARRSAPTGTGRASRIGVSTSPG